VIEHLSNKCETLKSSYSVMKKEYFLNFVQFKVTVKKNSGNISRACFLKVIEHMFKE
jgi:hypothetical protein